MSAPALSIVIPVLNDAQSLARLLQTLSTTFDAVGRDAELIVVDGGSEDDSVAIASNFGGRVLRTQAGRGLQLNRGCRAARGAWLWMMHADSLPGTTAIQEMCTRICTDQQVVWGRFDICFPGDSLRMRLTAEVMNGRSRLTGICTGDQGIFVHRRLLERIGGVPEQPLMEDIELSRRLREICRPVCLTSKVQTSARRWQRNGWWRTVLGMWRYRLRYFLGESAQVLAQEYYSGGEEG